MSEAGPPSGSRIAIKFGKSATNGAAADKASRAAPASSLGKRPRARHGFEADIDPDESDEANGKHESISILGEDSSASTDPKHEKPLVIQRQGNADWKSAAKARRTGQKSAPEEVGKSRDDGSNQPADDPDKPLAYGLIIKKKDAKTDAQSEPNNAGPVESPKHSVNGEQAPADPDKEAVEALLDGSSSSRQRVIARSEPRDEINAFKRDIEKAATHEEPEFDSMPVEEFGAALLRGMGWKGQKGKAQTAEVKRRDNLLGLGAKHLKGEEELGAWNQKRPKLRDHRHEEEKRKASRDSRRHESYKEERDRERQERDRSGGHRRERQYNHR